MGGGVESRDSISRIFSNTHGAVTAQLPRGPRLWNLLSICSLSVQTERRHNSACSVRLISSTLNQLRLQVSFKVRWKGLGGGWEFKWKLGRKSERKAEGYRERIPSFVPTSAQLARLRACASYACLRSSTASAAG